MNDSDRNATGTTPTTTYEPFYLSSIWIAIKIPEFIGSVFTLYIAISIITYYWRYRNRHKNTSANFINFSCCVAAVLVFFYVTIDPEIVLGSDTDIVCQLSVKTKLVFYYTSLYAVYIAIWHRQRILYNKPILKRTTTLSVRIVSTVMPVAIILACGIQIMFDQVFNIYYSENGRCFVNTNDTYVQVPVILTLNIFIQGSLLFLLIRPLMIHRNNIEKKLSVKDDRILELVKRAVVTTTLAVLTDLATYGILVAIRHSTLTFTITVLA